MGHSRALCYAASIALLLSGRAPAQTTQSFSTGNALLDLCTSGGSYFSSGACLGYISGVADTAQLLEAGNHLKRYLCVPAGVTRGQLQDVVVKYLKDHPEDRQIEGEALVYVALGRAFPCGSK